MARARGFHQSGNTERRIGAQLQRVAEAVVESPENDVNRLQAIERLDEDAAIANSEVATLDERESEIASKVGVLEVGLVERTGREQHHARRVARRARQRRQCVALRPEERRQPLDLAVAKRLGEAPRQHDAIFERISGTRWRLRAIGEHPPLTVGRARKVYGMEMEMNTARHRN